MLLDIFYDIFQNRMARWDFQLPEHVSAFGPVVFLFGKRERSLISLDSLCFPGILPLAYGCHKEHSTPSLSFLLFAAQI